MTAPDSYEFRASLHRIMAGHLRLAAAKHDVAANVVLAARSIDQFAAALNRGAAQDMASHPDLAELNAQMKGFYEQSDPKES